MSGFTLRLRTDRLRECRELAGLTGTTEFASRIGMSRHTANRMINQAGTPSQRFIAGLLGTFTPLGFDFDEFFEVIPATRTSQGASVHALIEDADTLDLDIEGAA